LIKHKIRGHATLVTPLIGKILSGHVRTVPGNMGIKFEANTQNK